MICVGVLTLLQVTGSSPRWSYSQMNICICLFSASYTQFFCYDLSYSSSMVVPVCLLCVDRCSGVEWVDFRWIEWRRGVNVFADANKEEGECIVKFA